MRVVFQEETWAEFRGEADALFPLHWAELALDKEEIRADMDHERYLKMEEMGMLSVVTARTAGKLVGYYVNFLIVHMHYKSAGKMAMADSYFLLPEFRTGGNGIKLFKAAEAALRRLGVVRAHTSCKVHQDHEELFVKLGWKFTDKTFSKMLKGN